MIIQIIIIINVERILERYICSILIGSVCVRYDSSLYMLCTILTHDLIIALTSAVTPKLIEAPLQIPPIILKKIESGNKSINLPATARITHIIKKIT